MARPHFEIHTFSPTDLFGALSNEKCSPSHVAKKPTANFLADYLRRMGTETLLVEYDYIDGDYLDDFAAFYVKCHSDYSRRCKRVHFFSRTLDEEEFIRIVQGTNPTAEADLGKSYVGFVVARPLPDAVVGRTLLRVEEQASAYYPCARDYEVHIFGIGLSLSSLAFQEQDTVLAACATVSLWSCFHKTATLFGTALPTPAMITRAANRVLHHSRPIPSRGLVVDQICGAIRQVDLEPEVMPAAGHMPLVSAIYAHLQMGLPVVLGVEIEGGGLHAITLTGFSLGQGIHINSETTGDESLPMVGRRINKFFAHDDQFGPFSELGVRPSKPTVERPAVVAFEGMWTDVTTGKILTMYPRVVIVPVYHKIRVTFMDIQAFLIRLHRVVSVLGYPKEKLEWDVHLVTSNAYKKDMRERGIENDTRGLDFVLTCQPRFMWRAVLRIGRTEVLELLADATDMSRSFPFLTADWPNAQFCSILRSLLREPTLQQSLVQILTEEFLSFLVKTQEETALPSSPDPAAAT